MHWLAGGRPRRRSTIKKRSNGLDMSDDDRPPALQRFIADLNEIWTAAGPPSFAELEAMSRNCTQPVDSGLRVQVLVHSTTQGILAGRRRSLPRWGWVASFVTVLRIVAAKNGVNPDNLGSLLDWKAKHEAAAQDLREARRVDQESDETEHSAVKNEAAAAPGPVRWRVGAEALAMEADRLRPILTESERAGRASLLTLAKRTVTLGWWQNYRDVVPDWFEIYLSLEPAATLIRSYETEYVSDLLQTERYAEAVIRTACEGASSREVRRRLELRMSRQQILSRPNPTTLWMLLDETVLSRPVGGSQLMRDQIDHLIEVSQQANITIQVMPGKDGHAIGGGSITVLRFAEQELPDVTYLQQPFGGLYPAEPSNRVHFGQVLDRLAIEAEKPAATIDFLHALRSDI
jgi:hypothetical protein